MRNAIADASSSNKLHVAYAQLKTGPFGPVFRFLGSSLEIDRGVPCATPDELQIHQRQLNDFRFFFLNDFNNFNFCFDFQHLPSPESRNGPDSNLRPK